MRTGDEQKPLADRPHARAAARRRAGSSRCSRSRWCSRRRCCGRAGSRPVLLFVAIGELAFFGLDYNARRRRATGCRAPSNRSRLQRDRDEHGPSRIFPARTAIHPSLHVLFGLEVMRGYDALEPADYVKLLRFLNRDFADVPWVELDFSTLALEPGTISRALFDFMGVRWALSTEPPPGGFEERWRHSELASTRTERSARLHAGAG